MKEVGVCDACGKSLKGRKTRCGSCSVMLRRARLKVEAIELLGGRCQQCGCGGHPAIFEFHHKDPSQKEFAIGSHWDRAKDAVMAEVQKCELFCGRCHNILHSSRHEDDLLMGYVFDYTGSTYQGFYRWLPDEDFDFAIHAWRNSRVINAGRRGQIKTCRLCGRHGADEGTTRAMKDVCLDCLSRVQRTRVMLASIYHLGSRCERCGWAGHPSGFSFHHGGGGKDFLISRAGKTGWSKVIKELAKCTLLCRNCHNETHSNRFDGHRFALAMRSVNEIPLSSIR